VTPREKLQCLSESYGALKTAVVDFHKGKHELLTMDDILPITIYAVSQAHIPNISSEFKFLEDYIKIAEQHGCKRSGTVNFELEKKILTNYNCGVIFVSKEWEPPACSGTMFSSIDKEIRSSAPNDKTHLNLIEPTDITREDQSFSPDMINAQTADTNSNKKTVLMPIQKAEPFVKINT